ncbi:hypothetical protein C8A01DRAFT_15683, partial [Parachaetomium inaequale]
ANCYISKTLNFGQRTTSLVESVNRYLKSFLVNGNSTVFVLIRQSFYIVKEMQRNIREVTL